MITKIAEEIDDEPVVWKVIDEHNNLFIKNLKCNEDHRLFTEWNMYYYYPSTNYIEEVKYDLFQEN